MQEQKTFPIVHTTILPVMMALMFTFACSLGGNEVAWASRFWVEDITNYSESRAFITLAGVSYITYLHNNDGQIWLDEKYNNSAKTKDKRERIISTLMDLSVISNRETPVSQEIWSEVLYSKERYLVCKHLAVLALDNRKLNPKDFSKCPGIRIANLESFTHNEYLAFVFVEQSSYQLSEIIKISTKKILDLFADYDPSEVTFNFSRVVKLNTVLIYSKNGELEWVAEGKDLDTVLGLLNRSVSGKIES